MDQNTHLNTPPPAPPPARRRRSPQVGEYWKFAGKLLVCINLLLIIGIVILGTRAISVRSAPSALGLPTPLPAVSTRIARATQPAPTAPPSLLPTGLPSSVTPGTRAKWKSSQQVWGAPLEYWWQGNTSVGLYYKHEVQGEVLRVTSKSLGERVVYRSPAQYQFRRAKISPDHTRLAVLERKLNEDNCVLSLWDITLFGGSDPRQIGQRQQLADQQGYGGLCELVSWSPDGNQIVTLEDPASLRVWDHNGQPFPTHRYPPEQRQLPWRTLLSSFRSLSWSPDGSRLAIVDSDGIIVLIPREKLGLAIRTPRDQGDILLVHSGRVDWKQFDWASDSSAFAALSENMLAIWTWDGAIATPRIAYDAPIDSHFGAVAWAPRNCTYSLAWTVTKTAAKTSVLWLETIEGDHITAQPPSTQTELSDQLYWQEVDQTCRALTVIVAHPYNDPWQWLP